MPIKKRLKKSPAKKKAIGFHFPKGFKRQKKDKAKGPRVNKALWDLDRDGITYSFLSKFVTCPERTRIQYIEGLTEKVISVPLEFGNAFHSALEYIQEGNSRDTVTWYLSNYAKQRLAIDRADPAERQELERVLGMAEVVVRRYSQYWEVKDKDKNYIFQEETFEQPITLPSGRTVKLRGRWDAVYQDDDGMWLQENKTKSQIDEQYLQAALPQDLQTMLYCVSLRSRIGVDPHGVLYNVARRPSLKQKQNESLKDFVGRIEEDILDRPEWYFMRWHTYIDEGDITSWSQRTLYPLLQRVCDWWDSIKSDPLNPEYVFREENKEHYQRPMGIYDSLGAGQRGDFFDLITKGNDYRLTQRDVVFPELED